MASDSIKSKRDKMESQIGKNDIIVIDNGAETCKIGFSGEDKPRVIIDTVGGIPVKKDDIDS